MHRPQTVPAEALHTTLTPDQALRLNVPLQDIWFTLRASPPRMAADVWSVDGLRLGGTLEMKAWQVETNTPVTR